MRENFEKKKTQKQQLYANLLYKIKHGYVFRWGYMGYIHDNREIPECFLVHLSVFASVSALLKGFAQA